MRLRDTRYAGTVKRLVRDKGFGFLHVGAGRPDVFFHRSTLPPGDFDRLSEGDRVSFTVADSPKGPRAANVAREYGDNGSE